MNDTHINNSKVGGALWVTEYPPQHQTSSLYTSTTAYTLYAFTFDLAEPLGNQTLQVSVTFSGNKAQTGGHLWCCFTKQLQNQ